MKTSEPDEHGAESAEVGFKAGRGLALSFVVMDALGMKTVEAEERSLSSEVTMLAQVFAAKPEVLASASVLPADAERLEKISFRGARIVRLDRSATPATKLVDVIFALERDPAPAVGEFVEVRLASEPQKVLSVPIASVLDSATGAFVYVLNGEYFLRTAVKTGLRSGEFIEITDGLYPGDVVVATAVEQLWLTELRLTKGGGHSH